MARHPATIPVWTVQLDTGQRSTDGFLLTASIRFQIARYVGHDEGMVCWGVRRATVELVPEGCELTGDSIASDFQAWSYGSARRGVVIRAKNEDRTSAAAKVGNQLLKPMASLTAGDAYETTDEVDITAEFQRDAKGTSCVLTAADPHPVFEVEAALLGSNEEVPFNGRVAVGLVIGDSISQGSRFVAEAKFADGAIAATVIPSMSFAPSDVLLDRTRFTGPYARVSKALNDGLPRMKEAVIEALVKRSILPLNELGVIMLDGKVLEVDRDIEPKTGVGDDGDR